MRERHIKKVWLQGGLQVINYLDDLDIVISSDQPSLWD
jgi:hypothetical protein